MNSDFTKKVLLLTYYWPPAGGAGVQRWLKFCKYLPQYGVSPSVITVDEQHASYPLIDFSLTQDISSEIKIIKTASFEPLNFYQKVSGRKQIPYAGFANEKQSNWKHEISRFIRGNFFIPDARRGWISYALKAAVKQLENREIKTLITTSPPHSTQLAGLKLKEKYDINWIADLRDPWTDIYYYSKMNHTTWAKKLDAHYEKTVLEQADKVIVVSEFIKQMFVSKSNKVNPDKIHVIPNGYDEEDFENLKTPDNHTFIIAYNGTLAPDYPVETIVEALKLIVDEDPHCAVRIQFTGSIEQHKKDYITNKIPHHCHFLDSVSHQKSIELLSQSHVSLLIIPDVSNNEGILTGKLFEYLAIQNPIIGIGPKRGEAAAIIQKCMAGYVFEKTEINELANRLKIWLAMFKRKETLKLNSFLHQQYSRKKLTQKLVTLISD